MNYRLPETKCKFSTDIDHMLSNIEITRDILLNKLNKLNSNKALGVDGIVPRILVENSDVLSEPNVSDHIRRFGLIKETQHMVLLKIGHA